jgi:sigma-B regulation protein RsbU (phosphoserine phosphatase)
MNQKRDTEFASEQDFILLKNRALDEAAEGITISDPSLPDNPIIFANAGFERLTGYSVEKILGKNCRFLQGPDTDPATATRIRAAIQAERPITVEILNYRKDKTTFWNRLSITPVRNNRGKTTHFIGIQSDITKRREAEDALRTAKDRMSRDLEMAARVQQSLLPTSLPKSIEINFAWRFQPCDELAGDILNVFRLDANHIGLYLLDVSGHGVKAALLSVSLSHWLSPVAGQTNLYDQSAFPDSDLFVRSTDHVMKQLNRQFPMDEDLGQYFTIVYAILDTKTFTIRYTSAGHPPPIRLSKGSEASCLTFGDFPIGMVENHEYQEESMVLAPGDRLYFYSDGVTETSNSNSELFDISRLLDIITQQQISSLEQSVSYILTNLKTWCGKTGFQDDVSILALERTSEG